MSKPAGLKGIWVVLCTLALVMLATLGTHIGGRAVLVAVAFVGIVLMLGTFLVSRLSEWVARQPWAKAPPEPPPLPEPPRCLKCGYDLRASRERCPECGSPIPGDEILQTPMVQRALKRAHSIAVDTGADYVGTEHVLLALFSEPDGAAYSVLDAWGINESDVRDEIRVVMGPPFAKLAPAETKTPEQPA